MRISTNPQRRVACAGAIITAVMLCGMARPHAARAIGGHHARVGPDSLALDSSYFEESCAPTDGPAVTLFFGGRVLPKGRGEGVKPPYVTVTIWRGSSTLAGHTFLLQPGAGGGFASYCARNKKCEHLDFARVSFDVVTRERVRGTADLTLQEEDSAHSVSTYQASIPFNARRLRVRMVCG
jgi:hypothetical protein